MKVTKTSRAALTKTVGTAGTLAAACAACCVSIPMVGPLLAWLGLSSVGAAVTGWYLPVAAASALGLGILLFVRRRRKACRVGTRKEMAELHSVIYGAVR
jgi:hypothetical protein